MKLILIFSMFIFSCTLKAQKNVERIKSELQRAESFEQLVDLLFEKRDGFNWRFVDFDADADTTTFVQVLMSMGAGKIATVESPDSAFIYKTLDIYHKKKFRVQYILLDKGRLGVERFDSLSSHIMKKIESGSSFAELAMQYSMDHNARRGGDLGWFEEKQMYEPFDSAVQAHKTGEVFMVNMDEFGWRFIVKNTYHPRIEKVIAAVRMEVKK
ncbi:hypothetical protein WSM22_07720 [Cytophagales bacterium WSM2-2]|nr:hypothetical protein WSM22_07720 [Cytophagales bacterium WSM2-2]